MAERKDVVVRIPSKLPILKDFRIFDKKVKATLLNDGENFKNGEGSTPNHDRVIIVYPEQNK